MMNIERYFRTPALIFMHSPRKNKNVELRNATRRCAFSNHAVLIF